MSASPSLASESLAAISLDNSLLTKQEEEKEDE